MEQEAQPVTPGKTRVVTFTVRGGEFCYRIPSRADLAAVARKYALKLAPITGLAVESNTIEVLDGVGLEREAKLEVGLVPRKTSDGKTVSLGEHAPTHWLDGDRIDFSNVDPGEFSEVGDYLDQAVWKKKPATHPQMPPSGATATESTKG